MWGDLGTEADDGSYDWSQQVRVERSHMSHPTSDCNLLFCCRGYAFITFTNKAEAEEAVKQV